MKDFVLFSAWLIAIAASVGFLVIYFFTKPSKTRDLRLLVLSVVLVIANLFDGALNQVHFVGFLLALVFAFGAGWFAAKLAHE